MKQHKVKMLQM